VDETELDPKARYKVDSYGSVAWYTLGYELLRDEDYEWSGIETENTERAVMVMVGDDREFTFDVEELTKIAPDGYCHVCGQIGCTHDGR
jgi:hypothetical protein